MKKSVKDYDLSGKKVVLRCDLNVPIKEGNILDDTRIKASLETINYILDNGGCCIILSHLGKVKEKSDLEKNNLYPVSVRLGELLNKEVKFSFSTRGDDVDSMAENLKPGEVMLIQNTRYEDLDGKKESGCDLELAKYWASLGDIFINDAYGTCHRAHASNVGICKFLPSGLGFLPSREIEKIDGIMNEDTRPFVVIMGGAKVSDKIKVIENLINKCDKLLIGGAMAYTFLRAKGYNIGSSILDVDSIDFCKEMLDKYSDKIFLPVDSLVASSVDSDIYDIRNVSNIKDGDIGLDIGPDTIKLFKNHLNGASRVVINGTMGYYENDKFSDGTKAIYDYIVDNNIKTLVGGGDSAASVNKLSNPLKFYHISTGGGATLEYLEGKSLPGISEIDEKEED